MSSPHSPASMNTRPNLTALLSVFVVSLTIQCNEALPTYEDPANLFKATLEAHFSYGPYIATIDSTLKVYLNVRNIFDDTFDARVNIDGFVQIILVKDTAYHKTFRLTKSNVYSATRFDPATNQLTIDSGDSLRLLVSWNFIDDNGRNLRSDIFRYTNDRTCFNARFFAPPEFFVISGQVKLFDKTGYVFPDNITYRICHVTGWVPTCPRFPRDGECDYYFTNVKPIP